MSKKKLSLLIVDDNTHFVSRMISLLSESDSICTIHTANHYDEAAAMLEKNPDLALLDIHLQEKNGMDLLKRIKDSAKGCEVIMLSNYVDECYQAQCRKLGALLFLDKTNDFDLVPSLIKEFALQTNHKTAHCPEATVAINN